MTFFVPTVSKSLNTILISNSHQFQNSLFLALAASAATSSPTTTTGGRTDSALQLSSSSQQDNENELIYRKRKTRQQQSPSSSKRRMIPPLTPRAVSCLYMSIAMALHFGGYEFARSGALALFTSADTGFTNPAAYPFAIGLVTPVSLFFLYWYGLELKANGPRIALKKTTFLSVSIMSCCCMVLGALYKTAAASSSMHLMSKCILAILFVFQNSYAHLLYTQQWSFLGSVMTPTEGTKWFSAIAGLSSLICTGTATIVHTLANYIGLLGLIGGTCITLALSLLFADHAYALSEKHGFDPAKSMGEKRLKKEEENYVSNDSSLLAKTGYLFQRVPTLAALFFEVISFQSLSTVLNVCFVRQLKETIPIDTERASFTGKMYALINGTAGFMQFFVLPLTRKYVEPRWVYKGMPLLLLPILGYMNWAVLSNSASAIIGTNQALMIAAAAFFSLKTLDYALRNVVNEMVYQPLDFESRYLGKEVIGVFANRFGKSGMSMILSLATATFSVGVPQLSQFSLVVSTIWMTSCWVLSGYLPTNKEAEKQVQDRRKLNTKTDD